MKKELPKHLFLLLMLLIPALVLFPVRNTQALEFLSAARLGSSNLSPVFENYVTQNFPMRTQLLYANLQIKITNGQREILQNPISAAGQNGIFVGQNGLMKNVAPPIDVYVQENTSALIEFAANLREQKIPTYVALIPTSGAILQQNLPPYAQSVMVNQKKLIGDTYSKISTAATTVDAYSALISKQQQYIYYRTEDNLTALGGFFVASAMAKRMGGGTPVLSQYDITYAENNYYGDLFWESGYYAALPDTLSLFTYSNINRSSHEYLVTHYQGDTTKTYHTLYPTHLLNLGNKTDIYLGGLSPVVDIKTNTQSASRLLVFGDKTALAYLPFLADSYANITFADLSAGYDAFSHINPYSYTHILFAYGMESFIHTDTPAQATAFLVDEP